MAVIVDKNLKKIICDECNSNIMFNTEKDDSIISSKEVITDDCTASITPELVKAYKKDISNEWIDYGYNKSYKFPKNTDMCISSDYYNKLISLRCPFCNNIIKTKIHIKTDTFIKIYPPEEQEGGDYIWIKIK